MKKFLKNTGLVFVLILCGIIVFTAFPSNRYLWQVVLHGTPDIDDYRIFANHTVKAANPQPWRISANYNKASIPVSRLPYFKQFKTVAYLIAQDNAVVFEQYWDGYSAESLSNSFSAAKSIVSLLAGIARDEKKIVTFDQSVADFYPPYATDNRKEITIKDVLTMSAGLDWDEAYSSPFSITTKAYYGKDIESLISNLKLVEKPGVRHRYQSGVTELLSLIVSNAVGTTLSEYASEKLWTPIGAEHDALWSLDRDNGIEKAYCCFNTNVRDFARIGQLILNKGKWNGKQVISEKFINEATTPAAWLKDGDTERNVDFYGYQWWRIVRSGIEVKYARGILGQYIFVIPEKNMVVVRLGHKRDVKTENNYPRDVEVWIDTALEMMAVSTLK